MRINKLLTNGYELTEEEKANLKVTLQDVIGEIQSEEGYWRPFVNGTNGNLYWEWDTTPTGNTPAQRKILYWPAFSADPENSHLLWKLDDDESWTDLNITTSGARGPQGNPGQKGADGTDGTSVRLVSTETVIGGTQVTLGWGTSDTSAFVIPSGAAGTPGTNGTDGVSPTVTTSALPDSTQHPQGGTSVTITDKTGDHQFNVWNGINGEGATVNLLDGTGIHITENGTNYTIGVSADYALKSELPDLSPYATKTYANEASANALGEAETWVGQQNFATSAGLDANKQYAMTTNGWSDFTIPSTSGYLPLSGGTVTGLTTFSGSDFDHTLEIRRASQNDNYAHIGLNNSRGLSFKAFDDAQSHTLQLDMFPNQSNSNLIQLQHNGANVGNLIPAQIHQGSYTPSANDGILHIILESE